MKCKHCIHYDLCNDMERTVDFDVDGGVCIWFVSTQDMVKAVLNDFCSYVERRYVDGRKDDAAD